MQTHISIIDYGVGNLTSVSNALALLGLSHEIIASPEKIEMSTHVILPGVGSFKSGIEENCAHRKEAPARHLSRHAAFGKYRTRKRTIFRTFNSFRRCRENPRKQYAASAYWVELRHDKDSTYNREPARKFIFLFCTQLSLLAEKQINYCRYG
jgi:hypothetical protein